MIEEHKAYTFHLNHNNLELQASEAIVQAVGNRFEMPAKQDQPVKVVILSNEPIEVTSSLEDQEAVRWDEVAGGVARTFVDAGWLTLTIAAANSAQAKSTAVLHIKRGRPDVVGL